MEAGGPSCDPFPTVRRGGVDEEPAGRDGRRLRLIGLSGLRVGPRPGSAVAPGGGASGAHGDNYGVGGTVGGGTGWKRRSLSILA